MILEMLNDINEVKVIKTNDRNRIKIYVFILTVFSMGDGCAGNQVMFQHCLYLSNNVTEHRNVFFFHSKPMLTYMK
jgi:hypothetical protein